MLRSAEASETTDEVFGWEWDVEMSSGGSLMLRVKSVHAEDILTGN